MRGTHVQEFKNPAIHHEKNNQIILSSDYVLVAITKWRTFIIATITSWGRKRARNWQ
uniref:Uncharacterized protein n=1 Tax=Octopus bimaculoides TaxID=37653 RepID=A0A0L8I4G4_OCTBM